MRAFLPVIALCVFAASAFAASEQDLMATRYGNTLVIHDMFGSSKVWYNPDHTFHAASWLGDVLTAIGSSRTDRCASMPSNIRRCTGSNTHSRMRRDRAAQGRG